MTTIRTELVTPTVTLSPVTVSLESAKKLTKAEATIATAFAHWANVADQADDATLLLAVHLIVADSVSARRASEIAVEVLGSGRGWSKDKVTAVRWTAPIWEHAVRPDRPADDVVLDDDGNVRTVDSLISQVRTCASVIGKARLADAIASVDVPSLDAYITAIQDEADKGKQGDPVAVEAVEGEQADEAEGEDEGKSGWTLDHALATAIAKARKEGISDADILASFALAVGTLDA